MIEIKSAKTIQSPWVHWFLYGDTGSGKSTAAATFPDPLFVVPKNEGSMLSLAGREIPYVEATCRKDVEDVLSYLEDLQRKAQAATNGLDDAEVVNAKYTEIFPYQTLVIESLTHYLDLVIEEVTKGNKLDMDWSKWGHLANHLRSIRSRARNLDVHVVFTSLAKTAESADGKVSTGGPMIVGSMAYKLPSACDIIAFCECRPGKPPLYRTHFRTYKWFAARSRFRGLPEYLDDFDYVKVEPYLTGVGQV
jgi:hypothetical protein